MHYGLIIMNVQNDHMQAGPAGVPETDTIPDQIEDYIRTTGVNYRRKYSILDWHPAPEEVMIPGMDYPHFKDYGIHCVHDTNGAQHAPPMLNLIEADLLSGVYRKGQVGMGEGLSAFEAVTAVDNYVLDARLRYFAMERFDIVGLCVPAIRMTALHGVALGYGVRVLTNLVPPMDANAWSEFTRYGVECVASEQAWVGVG